MASAKAQSKWCAKDDKHLIQARLSPAAVARLDKPAKDRGLSGRAAVLEALLLAQGNPAHLTIDGVRLLCAAFRNTGESGERGRTSDSIEMEARCWQRIDGR